MQEVRIKDQYNRPLRDLRISVIDQCNFRCSYCMPKEIFGDDYPFMAESELLSFTEIVSLAAQCTKLGIEKVRITGGEPLMRRNIPQLVQKLSALNGIRDIGMTTNGVFLVKYAQALKEAGLMRVNVSLDALSQDIFQEMTGRTIKVGVVLRGIDAAIHAGLEVKVNMVVKKGVNDGEIKPLAEYCKKKGITLRFIEFMDVGQTNGWNFSKVVTKKEIYEKLQEIAPLVPVEKAYFGEVASRYRYDGTKTEVGFISSISETFCSSCTRARISADGKLFTCLFAERGYDLRELLRSNVSMEDIGQRIEDIWNKRTDRYSEDRTEETAKNRRKIEMSYIGG
ncbi:cyclic pyranopterin monophosphate synthase subunit MoaA [Alteribacillus persepolensis]|uniref:GTP 3',8-cyclase n=1 Tax=Alteribacillus persepolensis TaxID=568899 RepID=A0A1G8JKL6_9BACI|nr:GTP 3',8-cyclase MoaA [Alteribacillus persepolensis]SDI31829.1 cyclic pyranopterin monophosphate synthase subunit MoaA [Alteribacillus persepolensis]